MVRSRLVSLITELLFPSDHVCLICRRELPGHSRDGIICDNCRAALDQLADLQQKEEYADRINDVPDGLTYLHCAFPYINEAKLLIYRLKYDCVRDAAIPLTEYMMSLPAEEETLIVAVPTTRRRFFERGYNQSELLAQRLAKFYGMPWKRNALIRKDDGISQTKILPEKRAANVAGTMTAEACVAGQRILLIDDVYTTGATASEAVRALKEAGAVSVGMFAACKAGQNMGRRQG